MSDDWVPDDEVIRSGYLGGAFAYEIDQANEEFDRWLAKVKLEAYREVIRFGYEHAKQVHSSRDEMESYNLRTGAHSTWLAQTRKFDPDREEA